MSDPQFSIEPVRPWDLLTLTRMAFANMTGVDRGFTRSTRSPLGRTLGYLFLPLYFLTSGHGYKAVVDGEIVGCAFLSMRRLTGFVYNVNVNRSFRRKGIGRALMEHAEREVRLLGRRWVGLHVDDGNTPAQRLYESLGYHTYHHRFLRSATPQLLPLLPADDVRTVALSRQEGVQLWKLYVDLARREGDSWAARLIREDYDEGPPPLGRFYACHHRSSEIGCAWVGGGATWPTVRLLLRYPHWEQGKLLFALLGELQLSFQVVEGIDLHFGSREHYDAIWPTLRVFGFVPQSWPRILMLKELPLA